MSSIYVSPTGSGNKSGSDWANALAIDNLNAAIKKAGAGGTVLLAADAGTYKVTAPINISGAGTSDASVTIKGVSTKTGAAAEAVFEGNRVADWTKGAAAGNELFKLQKGAANLVFENLQVNNTGTVFRAAADVNNITIQHVDADNVSRFFEDYAGSGNATAKVTGLVLRDIEVHGFSEGVVRLQYGSEKILIENVLGDSEGQDGEFAIGVHLHGLTHDVVIRKTTMMNAKFTGAGYWNGDGFATEIGVTNVLFEDTVASGNADAGYDLKSTATKLVRAVSSDNAHNYRIWGEATMTDSVGLDPHAQGGTGGQYQVWVKAGGSLTVSGGAFADSGSKTTVFSAGANLTLLGGTEIVMAATAKLGGTNLPTGLKLADVVKVAASGGYSANGLKLAHDADAAASVPVVVKPSIPVPVITTPVTVEPAATAPVATAPAATTPVVKAPVITTPVVTAPAVTTPAATFKFVSTAAAETSSAAGRQATFVFDQAAKQGADKITGFGHDDVLVFKQALRDGNGDGIITFGSNGLLDIGNKAGTVALAGLTKGVRLLGESSEGFVYGDAALRPAKALESKLGVADLLSGDAGDKAKTVFFFDTDLDRALGADKVANFGAKDIVVTTTKLADVAQGGSFAAGGGSFALLSDGHDVGSFTLADTAGKAVTSLEYDGERIVGDVHYYVYSQVGSAVSAEALTF